MKCNRTQEECAFDSCKEHGCVHDAQEAFRIKPKPGGLVPQQLERGTDPPSRDRLREAADAIRAKLKEERALYQHYLGHCRVMLEQEDLHGLWDAAVNGSEVSNRIDTAVKALEALGVEP